MTKGNADMADTERAAQTEPPKAPQPRAIIFEAHGIWDAGDYFDRDQIEDYGRECFAAGRASRAQEAPAPPIGWKAVPIEPTPEMIAAAVGAVAPDAHPNDFELARRAARVIMMHPSAPPHCTVEGLASAMATIIPAHRALVAAAPPLPAAPEQPPRLKSTPYGPAILLDDVRDAERMDWLERQDLNDIAMIRQTNGVIGINVGSGPFYGKTLRAAIDAARAAAPKEPTP